MINKENQAMETVTGNAGFIYAWLRNYPLREAMRIASAAGAISTIGLGGIGKQASAAEVALLCQHAANS